MIRSFLIVGFIISHVIYAKPIPLAGLGLYSFGILSAAHLSHEYPDEPQSSGEEGEQHIEDEIQWSVMLTGL